MAGMIDLKTKLKQLIDEYGLDEVRTIMKSFKKYQRGPRNWERDKKIYAMRQHGHTYAEIGRRFGITGNQVSSIIRQIDHRLKHPGHQDLRDEIQRYIKPVN
jgi:transposase-like protein